MGLLVRIYIFVIFPASAWAVTESHGSLGLENTTYVGRLAQNPDTGSYSSVDLDYRGRQTSRQWGSAQANVEALAFFEGYQPLLNARELYVTTPETHQWADAKLSVGRKLETWSEIDRVWSLGVWEPRFRWDYLHPESQGLTGLFLEVYEADNYRFVVFASPYFIPDQNADVQVDQGRIVSQSPWASQPAQTVDFGGRETPVMYSIARPSINEVVQNPGGALMFELGDIKRGPWFRVAAAYKPINQLLVSAGPDMVPYEDPATHQPQSQLNVVVTPHIAYEYVYESSVGYQGANTGGVLSVLKDHPIVKDQSDSVIAQQLSPAFIVSPSVSWRFDANDLDTGKVEMSWLRRWGGNAPDKGQFADPSTSAFEPRFLYENAVSVTLNAPLRFSSHGKLRYIGQTIYEASGQGLLISNDITFQSHRLWSINVGADTFGSVNNGEDQSRRSMISRFQENDRIHGGVSYVF
jgi:hypothetical protein